MSEYLPGLAGVPATKSNISSIDGEKGILAYRGYDIQVLAEKSNFEETALLLLDGELPDSVALEDFDQQLRGERKIKYPIRELMRNLRATGYPQKCTGKPGLVHGVYSLPGGNFSRQAGSLTELSADGRRPHRPAHSKRFPAR